MAAQSYSNSSGFKNHSALNQATQQLYIDKI